MKVAHEQKNSLPQDSCEKTMGPFKENNWGMGGTSLSVVPFPGPFLCPCYFLLAIWTAMLYFSCQDRRHTLKSWTKINLSSIKMISSEEEAAKLISVIQPNSSAIIFTLIWPLSSLLSAWASTFPSLFWPYCFSLNFPVSITWHFPLPLHGNWVRYNDW